MLGSPVPAVVFVAILGSALGGCGIPYPCPIYIHPEPARPADWPIELFAGPPLHPLPDHRDHGSPRSRRPVVDFRGLPGWRTIESIPANACILGWVDVSMRDGRGAAVEHARRRARLIGGDGIVDRPWGGERRPERRPGMVPFLILQWR